MNLKHGFAALLLGGMLSLTAQAALNGGDAAPDFKAQASLAGKEFAYSLREQLKKGPVVVYFYPSAFTGGCNVQAHAFAENHDKFAAAGASVIGVSLDSIARLNDFSADPNYCAGKLAVASDADGRIARAFDLKVTEAVPGKKDTRGIEIDHGRVDRTTFVLTADGKVAEVIGGISPLANVEKALASVQRLAEKNAAK